MQHQTVEAVGPATGERIFRRHPHIARKLPRLPITRIGKAREPFLTVPQAAIEIVPDHPDETISVARDTRERIAESTVGRARAISVRGQEGANPAIVRAPDQGRIAILIERLAEMHESAAVP